jgi:iron complex outermembrane receptor protein
MITDLLRFGKSLYTNRAALLLGTASLVVLLVAPTKTLAEDQAADSHDNLEEIVVTGSAIRSKDLASEHPISIITAQQLALTGTTTLQDALVKNPAIGFQGKNSSYNNDGTGNNYADLHNLGTARVLVLIDGKRYAPSSDRTSEAVDLGDIPVSLIDHVEILKDGASPIYGSDAISGVINVILKHDVEGIEVNGQAGTSTHADGTSYDFSGTYGHGFENGHFLINVEHSQTDPIIQRTRSWANNQFVPIEPDGSLTVSRNPGGIAILNSPYTNPMTGVSSDKWLIGNGGALRPFGRPYALGDRYDLSTNNGLTIGQERTSANAIGHYDISSDVTLYGQVLFTDRNSYSQHGPANLGLTPVTNKYPAGFIVPATAPGNVFGQQLILSKVETEVGNAITTTDAPSYRILAGFQGTLLDRFDWDVSYGFSRTSERFSSTNQINFTHAEQEVGYVPCSAGDVAAGCVPGNFFGPHSLSQAALDYLRYTGTQTADDQLHSLDAKIAGNLFELPAGPFQAALGGDWRRLSGSYSPDPVTLAGDQTSADAKPTAGGYNVREGFLELKAPLLADLPLVKEFDISGATRISDYSSFGEGVTWKAGIDWAVNSDLRIRGGRSTGFRAPSISELYLSRTSISGAVTDPCDASLGLTHNAVVAANCRAQRVPANYSEPGNNYATIVGGNTQLQPETSQNWSAGVVLTPSFIPHLSVTADYFNVFVRNSISTLGASTIVDTCYNSVNLSDPLCSRIGPRGANNNLTTISDIEGNQGYVKVNGIDMAAMYDFAIPPVGLGESARIEISNATTFIFEYLTQSGPGGHAVELAGTVDQPTSATNAGSIPHFSSTGTIGWTEGPLHFDWTTRYIGAVHALNQPLDQPANHVHAIFYHDIAASYQLDRVTLIAGVNNLFDANPPFYDDGTVNTSEFAYDVIGRQFYFRISAKM